MVPAKMRWRLTWRVNLIESQISIHVLDKWVKVIFEQRKVKSVNCQR